MLMDSGNSSSMQSNSSGGDHIHDQEYDSRSFLPPQPLCSVQDPHFLHSFSDFRDPDFINWPNPGSDPNCVSFPVAGAGGPTYSLPPAPAKNPKKRTRASRRVPTTVLTTDTSNFRAMVQEFTGIPAPPFSAVATSAYSRLIGGPYRQRLPPASEYNHTFSSSSLLNMAGQTQLLGSDQPMGFPGQPDPILQSLLQQQQQSQQILGYQPDQSPTRSIARFNAAFESIADGGNNISNSNVLFSNSNNED